jgi:hypothetical protein
MMSNQDGLTLEQSGKLDLAHAFYESEVAESRVTKEVVRGLFRTTLRVGDIVSLSSTLQQLSQVAGINENSAILMQARLLIEIGDVEDAKEFVMEVDSKHLGLAEISELDLLKADIFANEFRFQEAVEALNQSSNVSINMLRRVAELELALQNPTESITALKRYVSELNTRNKASGDTKRFITASGAIFNLANQIWLEQKFPASDEQLSLSQSMKMLVDYCKSTSEELIFLDIRKHNQENSEIIKNTAIEQKTIHPKLDPDLTKKTVKQPSILDSLIDLTNDKPTNGEYSNGSAREWEANHVLTGKHFFAIEESGLAIATNFGICSMCEFLPKWHKSLLETKTAGRKSHLPHLSAGGTLTRYLAEMIQESSSHAPIIIQRSKLRAVRSLPPRYSA